MKILRIGEDLLAGRALPESKRAAHQASQIAMTLRCHSQSHSRINDPQLVNFASLFMKVSDWDSLAVEIDRLRRYLATKGIELDTAPPELNPRSERMLARKRERIIARQR